MSFDIKVHTEPGLSGTILTARIPDGKFDSNAERAIVEAFDEVAKEYARDFIQKNLAEIYSKIDVQAISNIVLLEVTKQVKNNIMEKK